MKLVTIVGARPQFVKAAAVSRKVRDWHTEISTGSSEAWDRTGIHYPIPLHLQRAYASMGFTQESFPVSEQAASRALSLPMFPTLTSDAQRLVAARVRQCVDERPVRAHVGNEASA